MFRMIKDVAPNFKECEGICMSNGFYADKNEGAGHLVAKANGHCMDELNAKQNNGDVSRCDELQNAPGRGIITKLRSSFPKMVPTCTSDEVPLLFREPHVRRGFRALDQPWSYYLLSFFQLHNESMNVWTHMVAFLFVLRKLLACSSRLDFAGDPATWPLLSGLLCGLLLYAASSGAHCLQSRSELAHYGWFMIDYAGVGTYGLGSSILHLAYCSEDSFFNFVETFYIPLASFLALLVCYCCAEAKFIYQRPYPFARRLWQMVPVACIYLLLISPIAHRIGACILYGDPAHCTESTRYHVYQIGWFAVSAFFFASEYPQAFRPGWCDHFFHSHQIFHVAIALSTSYQIDAVLIDFLEREDHLRSTRSAPTFWTAFGPVVLVVLAEVALMVYFIRRIKNKVVVQKEEGLKEQ